MARTEKPYRGAFNRSHQVVVDHGNPASTVKGPQRGAKVLSKPQTVAAKKKTSKDSRIKGQGLSCPSCGSTDTHLHVWFSDPYKHMCDTCQHLWSDFGAAVGGTSAEVRAQVAVCADSGLGRANKGEEASQSHLQGSQEGSGDFAPAEGLPKDPSCPSCDSTNTHLHHLLSRLCPDKQHHVCGSCQHHWTVDFGAGVGGTSSKTLDHSKSKPSTLAVDTSEMSVDSERTISDKDSETDSETEVDMPAPGKIRDLAPGGGAHLVCVDDSPDSTGTRPDQLKRKHDQVLSSPPTTTVVATTNLRTQRTRVEPPKKRTNCTRGRVGEGIGVHMIKNPEKNGRWEANLYLPGIHVPGRVKQNGFQVYLGTYATATEAKLVRDRASIKLRETDWVEEERANSLLNFPESVHAAFMAEHADWSFRDVVWKLRRSAHQGERCLVGVKKLLRKCGVRYEAKTTRSYYHPIARKNIHVTFYLGTHYESAEEAGRAYDRALLFLDNPLMKAERLHTLTNFRPGEYSDAEIDRTGRQYNIRAPQWAK